jgi:hypothetical protein
MTRAQAQKYPTLRDLRPWQKLFAAILKKGFTSW